MKKKSFIAMLVATIAAIVISAVLAASNFSPTPDPLFEDNLDALTSIENDLNNPVWEVYHRPDGGFNCAKGGNETC